MRNYLIIAIASALLLMSCASGKSLRAQRVAEVGELEGSFTLVMHGGNYLDDLETVAFLDVEGDSYRIRPFAPELRYKISEGLSAKEAMEGALHHVGFHSTVSGTWLKRILNEKGQVIGYELRPLYMPFVFGEQDVMHIRYLLADEGRVRVYIRLKDRVQRRLQGEGDSFIWGR